MPAEVYSATKPPAPYRAWLIASFLLLLASALAGKMVPRGSGSWTPGTLIQPQGWEMAFRPPAQFEEVDSDPQHFGATYVLQHRGPDGRLVELSFWRLRADDASAIKVAGTILEKSKSWFSLLLGPSPHQNNWPPGQPGCTGSRRSGDSDDLANSGLGKRLGVLGGDTRRGRTYR